MPDQEHDEAVNKWRDYYHLPNYSRDSGAKIEGTPFMPSNGTWSALSFTVSQYGAFTSVSDVLLQNGFDPSELEAAIIKQ
jgi:hypothetical protein